MEARNNISFWLCIDSWSENWRVSKMYDYNRRSTFSTYRQTSNINRTLVGNKIVDHSGAVGEARLNIFFNGLGKDNCKTSRKTFKFWDLMQLILEVWRCMAKYTPHIINYTVVNESDWRGLCRGFLPLVSVSILAFEYSQQCKKNR